jgi:putrescine aminotransferase
MPKTISTTGMIGLEEALRLDRQSNIEFHQRHLNPRLAKLLRLVGADVPVVRGSGSWFYDAQGNRYLDFLTGFGAASFGYGHPRLREAMQLVDEAPVLLQGLNQLAGVLAHNLSILAPAGLQRAFFANSGAEVVDVSLKLARAATKRKKLLACENCFHGRTLGALSLMDRPDFRIAFEPLLPEVARIPFGNADALERALRKRDVAGFIVEPIQGEGGMVSPPSGYLKEVRELCTRYGTLMIADEVQTGLGRTGKFFAVDCEGVAPDVMLLAKALGGGIMPLSAVLTTDAIFRAARGDTPRSPFHTPTFGANARACAAGLAAIEILVSEGLAEKAEASGEYLAGKLRELKERHPAIAEVRGRGLMMGIAFAPPSRGIAANVTGGVLNRALDGVFSGLVIMELHTRHHVMTAYTLNNPNVLRLEPPLNVGREDIDRVVAALDETLTRLRGPVRGILRTWRQLTARQRN